MSSKPYSKPIAVKITDFIQFGCPFCGFRWPETTEKNRDDTPVMNCPECSTLFAIFRDNQTEAQCYFYGGQPILIEHPRMGIPFHGHLPVAPPGSNGQYFYPLGIKDRMSVSCLICGGVVKIRQSLIGYVHGKVAGNRINTMFPKRALVTHENNQPDKTLVIIGGCNKHQWVIERLSHIISENGNIITAEIVKAVIRNGPYPPQR